MSKCLALHHTMKRWNIFEGTVETFFFSVCDNPGLCSTCKTTINHPPSLKRLSSFVPKNLAHLLTYNELFNNEEVSLFTFFSVMFQKKKLLQSLTPETQFELVKKSSLTFCCYIKNNCQEKAAYYFFFTIIPTTYLRYIFFSQYFFLHPLDDLANLFYKSKTFPNTTGSSFGGKKREMNWKYNTLH